MDKDSLKNRIVGSIALVSFFVIFIPMVLEYSDREVSKTKSIEDPGKIDSEIISYTEKKGDSRQFEIPSQLEDSSNKVEHLLEKLNKTLEKSAKYTTQRNPTKDTSASWLIQFAGFNNLKKTNQFNDTLVLDGYSPKKIIQTDDDLNPILVRLGPFEDKHKASELIMEFEAVYQLKGILIKVVSTNE